MQRYPEQRYRCSSTITRSSFPWVVTHQLTNTLPSLHQQPPISTNNLARTPAGIRRAQHPHDARDLPRVRGPPPVGGGGLDDVVGVDAGPGPHERRVLDPALDGPLELVAVGGVHGALDGAGVDGVDGGALGQLAGPHAGHGLDGGLGPAVDGLPQEAAVGADGGEVDDAAGAVRGQVRRRRLHEEERAEDVDPVGGVEVLDRDLGQLAVDGHAGVVDQDVDLEPVVGGRRRRGEVRPGGLDEGRGAVGGSQVGLHAEGLDAVLGLEPFGELLCEGSRGL